MKITTKEAAVLFAIRDSEYHSKADFSDPVWGSYAYLNPKGVSERGLGGVMASLQKKGLVHVEDGDELPVVRLLAPALAWLKIAPHYLSEIGPGGIEACKEGTCMCDTRCPGSDGYKQ